MSFILPTRLLGRNTIAQPLRYTFQSTLGATRAFAQQSSPPIALSASFRSRASSSNAFAFTWTAPLAVLAAYNLSDNRNKKIQLDSSPFSGTSVGTSPPFSSTSSDTGLPYQGEMPKSDLNVYNLGFGTVCGICSGIFIKKGAKFIAFLLGGGFVILQYLNTQRIVSVNWRSLSSKYDSVVSKAAGEDAVSVNRPSSGWTDSTAARIWNRSVHFLTADFPSRGTFVAGLLLGLRLG